MSELAFGTEVAEDMDHETDADSAPATLSVSADEFAALEERILRAVNLVKRERAARAAAEERAAAAEGRLDEQAGAAENLNKEIAALRAEREAVRQRVDRLLAHLDALEA